MIDILTLQDTVRKDVYDFSNILKTRLNIGLIAVEPFKYVFEFFSNAGSYYRGLVALTNQGVVRTEIYNCYNKTVVTSSSKPGCLSSNTVLLNKIVKLIQK